MGRGVGLPGFRVKGGLALFPPVPLCAGSPADRAPAVWPQGVRRLLSLAGPAAAVVHDTAENLVLHGLKKSGNQSGVAARVSEQLGAWRHQPQRRRGWGLR